MTTTIAWVANTGIIEMEFNNIKFFLLTNDNITLSVLKLLVYLYGGRH